MNMMMFCCMILSAGGKGIKCIKFLMEGDDDVHTLVVYIGFYSYIAGFLFLVIDVVWSAVRKKYHNIRPQSLTFEVLFKIFLSLFLIGRILWMSFTLDMIVLPKTSELSHFLNQICISLFYTAFSLVVFYWAELFHKTYYESNAFLPTLGIGFITTNILIWCLKITELVMYGTRSEKTVAKEGSLLYNLEIYTDIVFSLTFALFLFFYGIATMCKNMGEGETRKMRKDVVKIIFVTLGFVGCFLLRALLLIYRFTTQTYLGPQSLFLTLTYFIPDIIPCFLQVFLLETSRGKEIEEKRFFETLYSE